MDELKIPNHVAIIMDGNGRWATNRGLKRSEGHKEGSKTLEKVAIHAINKGVKALSVYAFSTDNFKRTKEEVDYLMNLFILMFKMSLFNLEPLHVGHVFSIMYPSIQSLIQVEDVSIYLLSRLVTIPSYVSFVYLFPPVFDVYSNLNTWFVP